MSVAARPDLVVIGFSGNALEALDAIERDWRVVAFLDDDPSRQATPFEGIPVLPTCELSRFPDARVICLIGSPRSFRRRATIISAFDLPAARFATVVHPAAIVSPRARIGHGSLVLGGTQILANAVVGDHVCILSSSVVHHDARIGDATLVGSRVVLAGHVEVGKGCYIGSGSTVKNGLRLGDGCLVGMGSNVLRDVEPGVTVVGNPARPLRRT